MALPIIYYGNLYTEGTLSGSSSDDANPVRRVGDSDRTLKYTLLDSVGPDVTSGRVDVTLGSAATRDYLVMARGAALSGWTLNVQSEDIGGGNNASHGSQAMVDDSSFVLALSGTSTSRRVWRTELVSVSGITSSPDLYEIMLAKRFVFPQPPVVGVGRYRIQNYQRLDIPGGAPFKLRLGEDYQQLDYQLTIPQTEASGLDSFLQENDGGEPFWFTSDKSESFWAEMVEPQISFDDQAGVYTVVLKIREIPLEL